MNISVKKYEGIDQFTHMWEILGAEAVPTAKCAVYAGTGTVADAVHDATPVDTGDLRESVYTSKIKVFADVVNANVNFWDYDRRGAPNLLKARVLEKKHPFFRKAVKKAEAACTAAMERAVEKRISQISKGVN
jgi:hypothetical protein